MEKKKILFIITKANWGGGQKYVFDLATNLSDFKVAVAYGQPFGELEEKIKKEKEIKTYRIENSARDINLFKEVKAFWEIFKIIKKERPDILHLNSPKAGGLGSLAGRMLKIPKIIYTAHGWSFNEDRSFFQTTLIKFFSWLIIILSHKTIVIAQKEYQQIKRWLWVKNKLKLIYNGLQPICFLNRDEAQSFFEEKISSKLNDNLIIGTIAELTKNKGLKYAIKGFKKIADKNPLAKFIIIGEGEDREYLENKIKKYHLENKVFLIGKIIDASKYLKAFDIFLLSSIKEGFPFVLLEAGLAQLPVIATEVGGIPELIQDNKTGILVKIKEDDKIEDALEKLISNEPLKNKLAESLYNKIKEEFSFEAMLERTKILY
ncbi:MAG: glycosyltransferase family 4 protein [Patescibacteria group bacterium]